MMKFVFVFVGIIAAVVVAIAAEAAVAGGTSITKRRVSLLRKEGSEEEEEEFEATQTGSGGDTTNDSNRKLEETSLTERWSISVPSPVRYSRGDYLRFTLDYEVSDYITDDNMIAQQIYDENCTAGGVTIPDSVLLPSFVVKPSEGSESGDASSSRRLLVETNIDFVNPESNVSIRETNIYSESSDGSKAYLKFCQRLTLLRTLDGPTPVVENSTETLITITCNSNRFLEGVEFLEGVDSNNNNNKNNNNKVQQASWFSNAGDDNNDNKDKKVQLDDALGGVYNNNNNDDDDSNKKVQLDNGLGGVNNNNNEDNDSNKKVPQEVFKRCERNEDTGKFECFEVDEDWDEGMDDVPDGNILDLTQTATTATTTGGGGGDTGTHIQTENVDIHVYRNEEGNEEIKILSHTHSNSNSNSNSNGNSNKLP